MAVTTNPRPQRAKTVYLVDGAGTTIEIPTVAGLKYTRPFKAPVDYRENGDLAYEPQAGEEAPGSWEFTIMARDVEFNATGTTIQDAMRWESTYARANWVPTNAVITGTDVDDCGAIPLFTLRETDPGCQGSDAETVELRQAYLTTSVERPGGENGTAPQITFSGSYRSHYNSRKS